MKKPISPKVHGIIDYGFAVAQLLAPPLLGLTGVAKKLAYAEAANTFAFNSLSDHPTAIRRSFSFNPVHKVLDIANLAGLLVLPKITGADKQPPAKRFFAGIFLSGCIHVLLTDYDGDTE